MTNIDKARELRLRRAAATHNLTLSKVRRKSPLMAGFGMYELRRGDELLLSTRDLGVIEAYLLDHPED